METVTGLITAGAAGCMVRSGAFEARYEGVQRGPFVGACWLCGEEGVGCFTRGAVVGEKFVYGGWARRPGSELVCSACTFCLGHAWLRWFSVLAGPNVWGTRPGLESSQVRPGGSFSGGLLRASAKPGLASAAPSAELSPGSGESLAQVAGQIRHRPSAASSTEAAPVSRGLRHPVREEWREFLLAPGAPPWAGAVSVTSQRWLFPRMEVTRNLGAMRVLLEDVMVVFSAGQFAGALALVEPMLAVFSRKEVLTGDYRDLRGVLGTGVRGLGGVMTLSEFREREAAVASRRREPLFRLALHLGRRPKRAGRERDATREG